VSVTPPEPYVPYAPLQGSMRALYPSMGQVSRLTPVLEATGGMSVSWQDVSDVLDPFLGTPGQFMCRADLGFVRRGVDQPMPLTAGRAPDRVGVLFFSMATDPATGMPLILSGDRVTMVTGPVFGVFEIRVVPDVAQDFVGAHHCEVQIVEVSQALQPGSPMPFPGSAP
jgi:hypothetical protein